jgi:hypothetical protein
MSNAIEICKHGIAQILESLTFGCLMFTGAITRCLNTVAVTVTTVRLPTPGSREAARSNKELIYFFLRFLPGAVFSTAKSSSFFPSLIAATSHRGLAPLPAQVLPALSRYFGGTFLPLNDPPRPLLDAISPPNLASWLRSSVLLRLSSFPTSSRNCKSCSTDIEPRVVLAIGYLSRQRKHHTTFS